MGIQWRAAQRLLGLLWRDRPARRTLVLGLAEDVAGLVIGVAAPLILGRTIERLPIAGLTERLALVVCLAASWTAPSLLSALKPTRTAALTARLYRRLAPPHLNLKLPALAIGGASSSGEVAGVLERLPFNLQLVFDGLVWRAAPATLQLGLTLAVLAWSLPVRYAALLAGVLALYLLVADRTAVRLLGRSQASIHATGALSAELGDLVSNAPRIVFNGALAGELARLSPVLDARDHASRRSAEAAVLASGAQNLLLFAGLTGVLSLAAVELPAHRLTLGGFIVLQAFALRLALPLTGLAISLRQAGAALIDLNPLLREAPLPFTPLQTARPGPGALVLDRLNFTYAASAHGVRDIALTLYPDQMVAIVGANGSGKSTLARLMAGLLEPDQGQVRIGDLALCDLPLQARPARVLYVPQFIGLFHRSLGENAGYPPAEVDETALAARLRAWRFYPDDAPISLDTPVGEHGAALSGGQVQKLELARLYAVETPILILDESTSALDAASETEIIRTLRARASGRLLILVTHKRRIAEAADRVIFLDAGRLSGVGRHTALMGDATYRSLWT